MSIPNLWQLYLSQNSYTSFLDMYEELSIAAEYRNPFTVITQIPLSIDPSELFLLGEAGAWYDPSDLSTLWQDTAGTVPAIVGDPVGRIDDKSGNALHMTQATAAARPTLRQDAGGGYYLERDGGDDYMATASSVTLEATWTLAYAGQFAAGVGTSSSAYATIALNTTNYHLIGFRQDVGAARAVVRADSTSDALRTASGTNGLLPAATNGVVFSYLSATEVGVAANGDTYATTALGTPPVGPVAACSLRLGTQGGAALIIASRCYGLIAVKRALTASERAGLRAYYVGKMGA
jgi:hypothetical protein